METGTSAWVAVALFMSFTSFVLGAIAYWRSGGREDIENVRRKHQLLHDELSRHIRKSLEETRARARRADERLSELKKEAASSVYEAIDELSRELADIERQAKLSLDKVRVEISAGAQATEEELARRVHHIEGSIGILAARGEIHAANRLADVGRFVEAEELLEDAVLKVREARMRLYDEGAKESAFGPVLETLHDAIRSVRARAEDHRRQIDSVLSASDSLLASLRVREEIGVA